MKFLVFSAYFLVVVTKCMKGTTAADAGDCYFEDGLCGWSASTFPNGGKYAWGVHSGTTDTAGTGPTSDHKGAKTAQYALADGSNGGKGQQAVLTSLEFPPTNDKTKCMCFFYNAHGDGVGRLFVETTRKNVVDEPLFVVTDNQQNVWHKECVNIQETQKYRVRIIAERGDTPQSDVAVDDITFTDGKCPVFNFFPGLNAKPFIPNRPKPVDVYGTENKGCFEQKGAPAFNKVINIGVIRSDDPDTIKVARIARDHVLSNDKLEDTYAIRNRQLFLKSGGAVDIGDYIQSSKCDDYIGLGHAFRVYTVDRTLL